MTHINAGKTQIFHCDIEDLGKVYRSDSGLTTGYGTTEDGRRACFECCGILDQERMIEDGKIVLYLTLERKQYKPMGVGKPYMRETPTKLTNWPGSLEFKIIDWSKGGHNWGIPRYDVWFIGPDNKIWYGRFQGEWTQLTYCRRTKGRSGNAGYLAQRYGLKDKVKV